MNTSGLAVTFIYIHTLSITHFSTFLYIGSDDVDKLLLKSMDVNYLRKLCGSFVDLANVKVRSRDTAGLGVPIICSPVYVFIHPTEKQRFADALGDECPDRFFALNADVDRFLACAQPRKIHCEHVMEALGESGVERVNALMYGCKSSWPLFAWLDEVDVDFEVDLGHVLTMNDPGIHLFGKGSHVDIGGFGVSIWPMLTSLQRDRDIRSYCAMKTSDWMKSRSIRRKQFILCLSGCLLRKEHERSHLK